VHEKSVGSVQEERLRHKEPFVVKHLESRPALGAGAHHKGFLNPTLFLLH